MGTAAPDVPRLSAAAWPGLVFAMTFPTVAAALYFLALGGDGSDGRTQAAYSAAKAIQFLFPLVFVFLADGRLPRPEPPRRDGLALGLGFGLLVSGTIFALYFGWLKDSALLADTPAMVRGKLNEFHVRSLPAYLGLAAFLVVAHSLLEEYYWRWFVFGRLCRGMRAVPAAVLSSLAFMSHHVVILYVFFPGRFLTAAVPFALAIAVGGAVWCWLFRRGGSIWAPWLSHLVIDAAIFVIGWDMVRMTG
jgi:membrane protease YdiL (CAAX protease family)